MVRVTETAKTEGSWLPPMRRQQLKTWRLAQVSGHHEQQCGCDAQHNDEKRICAPRKPGVRNHSYKSGHYRNPNNRSRNPDNSRNPHRPRPRPQQSVTERLPLSRLPQLRSVIAYISVNKPVVGQLGYQTQLSLGLFLFAELGAGGGTFAGVGRHGSMIPKSLRVRHETGRWLFGATSSRLESEA
jgi:hypothetical protein